MTSVSAIALVVMLSSGALAGVGGILGVGVARIFWADDLRHAQRIDEIRSRTEGHLRGIIEAQKQQVDALKQQAEALEKTVRSLKHEDASP